jgi:O-antigen biosynthesis protein WbqP
MYKAVGKRLFDILLVILLSVPSIALCFLCIVYIRLESSGPAIFSQRRVGRNQVTFTIYKLRTMSTGVGDRASHEVASSEITPSGRFLRRTKLDELPQLINVLFGDMSFVGPRPCLPSQSELILEREKRGAFSVRPGITGPAQLEGFDMSKPLQLAEIDGRYAASVSLTGDLNGILRTAIGRGRGDAVSGQ